MPNNAIMRLTKENKRLKRQVRKVQRGAAVRHYRGTSAIDFTLVTLPYQGDYGYQTTDDELQMNCDGAIRATAMAAV